MIRTMGRGRVRTYTLVPPVPERGDANVETYAERKRSGEDGGHVYAYGMTSQLVWPLTTRGSRGSGPQLTVALDEGVVEQV